MLHQHTQGMKENGINCMFVQHFIQSAENRKNNQDQILDNMSFQGLASWVGIQQFHSQCSNIEQNFLHNYLKTKKSLCVLLTIQKKCITSRFHQYRGEYSHECLGLCLGGGSCRFGSVSFGRRLHKRYILVVCGRQSWISISVCYARLSALIIGTNLLKGLGEIVIGHLEGL